MNDGIDFPGHARKPVLRRLAINEFDATTGTWREAEPRGDDIRLPALTCATFNTWFQGAEQDLRYAGLLNVLQQSNADVIVLQEVTERLLETMMSTEWVRSCYRWARAPFRADAIPSHGLMLLSRLPFHDAMLHPIPTHMGRNLLTAEFRLNGTRIMVATTHLESMKSHGETRAEQLRAIFAVLESTGNVLLAGDFNFCSSWHEENSRIDMRYVDVWAALRPNEPGFTQNTDVNLMLALAKRETKKVRIDRILLRSDTGQWVPESVQLLGTQSVSARHPKIFPSDHFGLAGTVRISTGDPAAGRYRERPAKFWSHPRSHPNNR